VQRRRALALGAVLLLVLAWPGPGLAQIRAGDVRRITIVGVSDWHGQLEPLTLRIDGKSRAVGGIVALKHYFDEERRRNPGGTLVVTAGDAFGATPPLSSFFGDVPAVEAQNVLGFDVDTLGNHNFDHGVDGLRKLMGLARFSYVAANIVGPDGAELAPPYRIFLKNGVKVAVIGIGNPATPELVFPGRIGHWRFLEAAPAINRYAAEARAQGAEVVVVIAHIGANAVGADGKPTGPLADVAGSVRGVDVLIGDHTDVAVNAVIDGTVVVENRSKGVQYSVIDLAYDVEKKAVASKSVAQKWALAEGVTPDKDVQALLDKYRAQLQPLFDRKVAETPKVLRRSYEAESLLGNLVTDILRATYGARIAFDVSSGFRADLPSSYRPADRRLRRPTPGYAPGPPYDIVVGDVYTVFVFGNAAVTFRITGEALWEALEHSVRGGAFERGAFTNKSGRFLQVSGFTFRFDPRKPSGRRIVSVTFADGTPIRKDGAEYAAVTSDFVYYGGAGYAMLNNGTGATREVIGDVVKEALQRTGRADARVEGRIIQVPPSAGSFSPSDPPPPSHRATPTRAPRRGRPGRASRPRTTGTGFRPSGSLAGSL
jgi:5'-nucleotidase